MLFLLLLTTILVLLLSRGLKRKRRLQRFRKNLELDKHALIFQKLYAELDGFRLSRSARANQDAFEYVYGEIVFEPFIALLSLCKPNSETVFYDLGSGTGKAVIAAAMVFNPAKSCGIELFSLLHQAALSQKACLKKISGYQTIAQHIEFRNEDLQKSKLSEANLIFINSTGFLGETWLTISKHLEQINSGSLVISTSKPLRSEQFIVIKNTFVLMSWGPASVFIQQRKPIGDCFQA
jgi:precorrin-6B methylase 2